MDDFRESLREREAARTQLAALASECDALISLAACGPVPLIDDIKGTAFPTGDVSFSCVSSLLGAPSVTTPVLAVNGMPLGIQVMGQHHDDAKVTGIACWLANASLG